MGTPKARESSQQMNADADHGNWSQDVMTKDERKGWDIGRLKSVYTAHELSPLSCHLLLEL